MTTPMPQPSPAPRGPNLFIIGAMKCGTTSLHSYLGAHPDVFMCEPKEPNFFVEELNWCRGRDWYLSLFTGGAGATVIGEASTEYTKLPTYTGVAERAHAFNPRARLVYLMRDPIERILSHYWHNVDNLREEGERRSLYSAVQHDPRYVAYSDYAMQLEPWLRLFGRERITILTLEELAADPAASLASLCAWLGLRGSVPAGSLSARWNERQREVRRARGWGILNRVRNSALWRATRHVVPERIRDGAARLSERRVPATDDTVGAAVEYLRPLLRPRVEELSRQLHRTFPAWTTLYGTGGETPARITGATMAT